MGQSRTDKTIIKTPPIKVSHINTLPPGLDEGGYVTDGISDGSGSSSDDSAVSNSTATGPVTKPTSGATTTFVPVLDVPSDFYLPVPLNITVKSQKINVAADGTYTVDVTLAFPDIPGALRYEVRFTT